MVFPKNVPWETHEDKLKREAGDDPLKLALITARLTMELIENRREANEPLDEIAIEILSALNAIRLAIVMAQRDIQL